MNEYEKQYCTSGKHLMMSSLFSQLHIIAFDNDLKTIRFYFKYNSNKSYFLPAFQTALIETKTARRR